MIQSVSICTCAIICPDLPWNMGSASAKVEHAFAQKTKDVNWLKSSPMTCISAMWNVCEVSQATSVPVEWFLSLTAEQLLGTSWRALLTLSTEYYLIWLHNKSIYIYIDCILQNLQTSYPVVSFLVLVWCFQSLGSLGTEAGRPVPGHWCRFKWKYIFRGVDFSPSQSSQSELRGAWPEVICRAESSLAVLWNHQSWWDWSLEMRTCLYINIFISIYIYNISIYIGGFPKMGDTPKCVKYNDGVPCAQCAYNSVHVQCMDQGLEPLNNLRAKGENNAVSARYTIWCQLWKRTTEEIDNSNSETLHGSGAVILVTQSRWAPRPNTHKQYIHKIGETLALTTGQAITPTTTTQAHQQAQEKREQGNRVGQSLDPDNTLDELWRSLQWQRVQEQ